MVILEKVEGEMERRVRYEAQGLQPTTTIYNHDEAGRGSISPHSSTRMLERDPSKTRLIARLRLRQASRVRLKCNLTSTAKHT